MSMKIAVLRRVALSVLVAILLTVGGAQRVAPVQAAQVPPPEVASYNIEAVYDPVSHQITASQTITYVNRTEAPIPDLVFHLYLNAFRSEDTLWMQEAGTGHRGFSYVPEFPGWIEIDELRLADGTSLTVEAIDADETLVRASLPDPIAPEAAVVLEMTFMAQLPRVFARTGWADDGDFVMVGQWFPKLGVWEDGAWNAHPFHANSEFYADFGTYDVAVTLPASWVVGATGTTVGDSTDNGDGTRTHWFRAEHVIDFAWGASPHFEVLEEMAGDVRVEVLAYDGQQSAARRVMQATTEGLDLYTQWYGPYGGGLYLELTVIVVPADASGAGGMEYPTLFTVGVSGGQGLPACVRFMEAETVHELAHQWFQSMIATNEAEAPWLDEGFAEYSTVRAMRELEDGDVVTCGGWTMSYLGTDRSAYRGMPEVTMAGRAWDFTGMAYGVAAYAKPSVSLSTLERLVGEEAMLAFLGQYAERYAFAHPDAEDVRAVMTETLGRDIADWFFDRLVVGEDTLDAFVAELQADDVVVRREGDLCVPVPVALVEAEETEAPVWACDAPFDPDVATLTAAEIDPDLTVLLDLNLANNGLRRQVDRGAWLGTTARALRLLQAFFRGGGLW